MKDLDKHDPKDIQWVEDPHPLYKCVKDPHGKKARTYIVSEKCMIYPHYFHRKTEIGLHLLKKHKIKTNIPKGLKVNDDEFGTQQKKIDDSCLAPMKRKGEKNTSLMYNGNICNRAH